VLLGIRHCGVHDEELVDVEARAGWGWEETVGIEVLEVGFDRWVRRRHRPVLERIVEIGRERRQWVDVD
jgi:hypothetical protein